ncbi:M14 family metallopeptidase [Pelagibius marinus]|uniref:M14 family metallopeptidase n=1 Tax=Pelagibius marinus TaxID=2762760 RepID=UPI001872DC09|nr:M14 family metallopeptidase [Pelagibius marinus]
MTGAAHFSSDYSEARRRFVVAAEDAGARLTSYAHPGRGPEGEELATDVAWLGPEDAKNVLVTLSGTHGVEGFCGSGVQTGWFDSGLAGEQDAETAYMAVHAINPHGFAWLRRVTEDNVDLNRNFVDFAGDLPDNPGYDELAEALCPATWDDATIAATREVLAAYAEEHGPAGLQAAITNGQYSHADGIFFGGAAPTWSHLTLKRIFRHHLSRAGRVAVIDYHTGLGPRGHGERICPTAPDSPLLARVREWYGEDFTCPALGTSSATEIRGFNVIGMEEALPGAELTAVALEYGTLPTEQVKLALRADNWLHLHGDPESAKGKAIKAQIREAFYQDADDWKELIWERALETQRLALAGLAG